MEQIIIEIRAAEGGTDSKLLVQDLKDISELLINESLCPFLRKLKIKIRCHSLES